ncbi:helix-turn-helix transcriptional regulator [bacterium]|nr:helix-turn-helix transcriptional regulator [bacterium]
MKLNLGNQIRSNRLRLDMTQEQLAEKFGTSPQAISRWENGSTYPDIELLPLIASFFGTSVDTLLGRTDEEKKKFCADLQQALTTATKEKDVKKTIDLLREIRHNLREYRQYWFWGIYHDLWNSRLFKDERVLREMRLLSEEIFAVCPRNEHFPVIEEMAYMEDDENVGVFLDTYASREDQNRTRLLFNRYKMREEIDKIEPIRQFLLWFELEHILTAANDWQEYLCKDAAHFRWFCETQLDYLNAVNCLAPDKKHIVSGGEELDLWCEPRIMLGLRYTRALSWLGEIDAAVDAFEDTVSIVEKVMSIKEDSFKLGCGSPALKGFVLTSERHWGKRGDVNDGKEYLDICLAVAVNGSEWDNWIIPTEIWRRVTSDIVFEPIIIDDDRFYALLERLKKCIVSRESKE